MPVLDPCLVQQAGRRRIFWTTQPTACGEHTQCDASCSIPGLQYVDVEGDHVSPGIDRTIQNSDWLQGLILNILNTRARTDNKCPSPAAVYGHWSESYLGDSYYIGSTLWNAAEKDYRRVGDAVNAIQVAIQADMAKLIRLKLVDKVVVEVTYKSIGAVVVVITTFTKNVRHVVNLAGAFTSGEWTWR